MRGVGHRPRDDAPIGGDAFLTKHRIRLTGSSLTVAATNRPELRLCLFHVLMRVGRVVGDHSRKDGAVVAPGDILDEFPRASLVHLLLGAIWGMARSGEAGGQATVV